MMNNMPILGIIYLIGVLILTFIIFYLLFKQYLGYKKLKRIEKLQEKSRLFKEYPNEKIKEFASEIVSHLNKKDDFEMDNLMYDEIIDELERQILIPIDKDAKKIIIKYSNQTAISTAISPVAFIDALLILSRSFIMINEIAKLYGYRPNFMGELRLFKKILFNLAFAGATEILVHHLHDFIGSSILSKLSYHSAQGVANGILTARIGIATIKACRPINYNDNDQSFLKGLTKKIFSTILAK